jgi:hypothetical protein
VIERRAGYAVTLRFSERSPRFFRIRWQLAREFDGEGWNQYHSSTLRWSSLDYARLRGECWSQFLSLRQRNLAGNYPVVAALPLEARTPRQTLTKQAPTDGRIEVHSLDEVG